MKTSSEFEKLHKQVQPFLLGNVWNVQSAKVLSKLNFQALGTSSAAIAHSLGYEDGEQVPFSKVLYIVERIRKSVNIPLSVDIEFGYGSTASEIAGNILSLERLGVAGINIEDSYIQDGVRILRDKDEFSKLLREIKGRLATVNSTIFINVRCDVFLLNMNEALKLGMERIREYEDSGASGIFVPCLNREQDIRTIVTQTKLPVNVMCIPELPDFDTLQTLGVKRISMGNFFNDFVYRRLEEITTKVVAEKSFNALFENATY